MRDTNRGRRFMWLLLFSLCLLIGNRVTAQTTGKAQLTTARFRVVFQGIGEFRAVRIQGLVSETLVDLSQESTRIQPRRALKPVHLVLARKAVPPDPLWQWRADILEGRRETRTGRVDLLDQNREPVLTWEIKEAWPFKWVWPVLDAVNPDLALEEIHFIAKSVQPAGKRIFPLPKLVPSIGIMKR